MKRLTTRRILGAAAAALALAVGGTTIAAAAGSASSPTAFMDSLAKHLGISTEKLQDAAKAAAIDQVDAALAAGEITKEQADAAKERINSGEAPLLFGPGFRRGGPGGFGPGGHHGPGGPHHFGAVLDAAAQYLGLTEAELREQLLSGKSLADVAKAEGKTVAGLTTALHNAVKSDLDAAVAAGRITQSQADEALARFDERVADLIAKVPGSGRPEGRLRPAGLIL